MGVFDWVQPPTAELVPCAHHVSHDNPSTWRQASYRPSPVPTNRASGLPGVQDGRHGIPTPNAGRVSGALPLVLTLPSRLGHRFRGYTDQ